jgi:L-ascorbate metabolism protein UlaG (beta-lactamase superfamily)
MLTVTRVNHASVLLDFDGQTILTDPWFSEKPGYHPGEPRRVALADLPPLAGVLVSHGHYDHYDMEAFRAYPDKAVPMIVKRGTARAACVAGFTRVTELDPWERARLGPLSVTATLAKHKVPENTYILQGRGHTVYFGGDTLLIPGLRAIAPRFPRIDLALLAINGLRLRPYTVWPRQVLDAFTQAVARRAPETAVHVLSPGQPLQIRDTIGTDSGPHPATPPSGVALHTPGRAEGQVRPC